jgi:hypothetical protein
MDCIDLVHKGRKLRPMDRDDVSLGDHSHHPECFVEEY